MFLQLFVNGLVTGSVYAIAAVGISLIYGILRLVNFAYGDMMAFGAFAGFFANATLGLPMVASAVFAMAAVAVLSVALDLVLWRPLRRRRAGFMSLFLASIGVALVLRQAMLLIWGPQPRAYDVDPFKVYVVGDVRLSLAQVATIVTAAVAIVVIGVFLARTSTGRVMRAMSDDRVLAQLGHRRQPRDPHDLDHFGPHRGHRRCPRGARAEHVRPELRLPAPPARVRCRRAGRDRSAYGALAGGLVLGVATELSTWEGFGGGVDPVYKPVVAFVVLIVALLMRPQGLFGRVRAV